MGILITFMLIGATISAITASNKQRSVGGWLVFGALMPLISVIAILCLPPVQKELTAGI